MTTSLLHASNPGMLGTAQSGCCGLWTPAWLEAHDGIEHSVQRRGRQSHGKVDQRDV